MSESEANLENLSSAFDKLNDVREQSLTISREIVRECSKSIRNVHRNDISDAEKHIKSAQKKLNDFSQKNNLQKESQINEMKLHYQKADKLGKIFLTLWCLSAAWFFYNLNA